MRVILPDIRTFSAQGMQVVFPIRRNPSLIPLLLAAVLLAGCASLRLGGSEAGLVIEDLMVGTDHSRLKSRTENPTRTSIQFGGTGDSYRGV